MAGGKKGKGKEIVSDSRRSEFFPPPVRLSTSTQAHLHTSGSGSNPSPSPPSHDDTPPLHPHTDFESPSHVPDSSSGPDVPGDRIFIRPRGCEFTLQMKCARTIGKVMEGKFNGAWKSYKFVPIDVRDMWFQEFEKEYWWYDEDRHQIRKNFDHVGSNILKNRLYDAKQRDRRPYWIGESNWDLLKAEWAGDEFKKLSAQNKKNRASDCGGQGFPLHIGGSISHLDHMDRLKEKVGHEPSIAEGFLHTHSKLNPQGERVWVDDRSRRTHEAYEQRYSSDNTETSEESIPTSTQVERWAEIVGGSNRTRVYGLAGMTSIHRPSRGRSAASNERSQWQAERMQWQEERDKFIGVVDEMRTENQEIRSENHVLKEKLSSMEKMMSMMNDSFSAKFMSLEQRFLSTPTHQQTSFPPLGPPPSIVTPYPPPDGSFRFMPTPSSHPSDPNSEDNSDDD